MWRELLRWLGPAGVVLAVLSCFSLYFSLKNTVYLYLVGRDFRRGFADARNGGEAYLRKLCQDTDNPLLDIVGAIVRTHAKHSKDIRAEVAYMFHRNFEGVTRGLTYLRLISVIAPLLGLLGTMLGMVEVFQAVATQANPDPAVLAAGIWEALLTTILGLCVAIPTLVFFYHLSLKMKGFRIEAIEHSYRAVELHGASCREDEEGAEPVVVSGAPRADVFLSGNGRRETARTLRPEPRPEPEPESSGGTFVGRAT